MGRWRGRGQRSGGTWRRGGGERGGGGWGWGRGDGEEPRERVDYIVGEVGAKVVITEEGEEGGWEGRGIGIGRLWAEAGEGAGQEQARAWGEGQGGGEQA